MGNNETNMVKRAKNWMKILAFYEIASGCYWCWGCCCCCKMGNCLRKRIDIFNLMKYFIYHWCSYFILSHLILSLMRACVSPAACTFLIPFSSIHSWVFSIHIEYVQFCSVLFCWSLFNSSVSFCFILINGIPRIQFNSVEFNVVKAATSGSERAQRCNPP